MTEDLAGQAPVPPGAVTGCWVETVTDPSTGEEVSFTGPTREAVDAQVDAYFARP